MYTSREWSLFQGDCCNTEATHSQKNKIQDAGGAATHHQWDAISCNSDTIVSASLQAVIQVTTVTVIANQWTTTLYFSYSGYSVHAYELLQVPVPDTSASTSATASRPGTTISEGEHNLRREPSPPRPSQGGQQQSGSLTATCQTNLKAEEDLLHSSSTHELHPRPSTSLDQQYGTALHTSQSFGLSRPETKSLSDIKKHPDKTLTNKEEAFLASLVIPSVAQTNKGRGEFKELFLPPPPVPDISHILSTSPSKRNQTPSPMKEPCDKKQTKKSPGSSRSNTPAHDPSSSSLSSHSKKNLTQGISSTKLKKSPPKSNSPTKLVEKQKLLQPSRERFCLPGKSSGVYQFTCT